MLVEHVPIISSSSYSILKSKRFKQKKMNDSSDLSGTDEQEALIQQLKQKNQLYIEKIASMQKQLNETLEFGNENEILKQKNVEISKKLRETESARDDFQKRLDVSLFKTQELSEENQNLKNQLKAAEMKQYNKEADDKRREKLVNQINQLTKQIQEDKEQKEKDKKLIDEYRENEKTILQSAHVAFSSNFRSLSDLARYLLDFPTLQNESTSRIIEQSQSHNSEMITKLTKCVEKLQNKLQNEKEKNDNLLQEHQNLGEKHQSLHQNTTRQISMLEDQVNELTRDLNNAKSDLQREKEKHQDDVDNLEAQIVKLESKVLTRDEEEKYEYLAKQNTILKNENEDYKRQVKLMNDKLNDSETISVKLQKQAAVISAQLQSTETTLEVVKKKLQKTSQDLQDRTKELDQAKFQQSKAELEKQSFEEQVKTLNAKNKNLQLSLDKLENALTENQNKTENIIRGTQLIEQNCENQKQEIKELKSIRDTLIALSKKQNSLLQSSEQELAQSVIQNKALKRTLAETESKLCAEIQNKEIFTPIPSNAWFISDFPRDLCSSITDFAKNESLDDIAKAKNILTVIHKYYSSKLIEQEKQRKKDNEDITNNNAIIDKFLAQISSLIYHDPTPDNSNDKDDSQKPSYETLSCETIIKNPINTRDYITKLHAIIDEKNSSTQKNKTAQDKLSEIYNKLEVNNNVEALQMITNLYQKINDLTQLLKDEKTKTKVLKKQRKIDYQSLNEEIEHLNALLKDNENECNKLNDSIQSLQDSNALKEKQIKKLTEDNQFLNQQNDEFQKVLQRENEKITKHMQNKIEKEKTRNQEEIARNAQEISNLKSKLLDLERENAQYKRSSLTIRAIKEEKDNEAKVLIDQFEEQLNSTRQKYDQEKQSLKDQYEQYLKEMQNKNSELYKAHQEAVTNSELQKKKIDQLLSRQKELERLNDELRVKVQVSNEEFEREKRFQEMREKSLYFTNEIKYQKMLEEQKANFFTEKRKIIGFVVHQFSEFFDVRKELDDECLRYVVSKAKTELEELRSQDYTVRKILKISDNTNILPSQQPEI